MKLEKYGVYQNLLKVKKYHEQNIGILKYNISLGEQWPGYLEHEKYRLKFHSEGLKDIKKQIAAQIKYIKRNEALIKRKKTIKKRLKK